MTHLGYYDDEKIAAQVYDKVSLKLHGDKAPLNFPRSDYKEADLKDLEIGDRKKLQLSLGVNPMNKSSR